MLLLSSRMGLGLTPRLAHRTRLIPHCCLTIPSHILCMLPFVSHSSSIMFFADSIWYFGPGRMAGSSAEDREIILENPVLSANAPEVTIWVGAFAEARSGNERSITTTQK